MWRHPTLRVVKRVAKRVVLGLILTRVRIVGPHHHPLRLVHHHHLLLPLLHHHLLLLLRHKRQLHIHRRRHVARHGEGVHNLLIERSLWGRRLISSVARVVPRTVQLKGSSRSIVFV